MMTPNLPTRNHNTQINQVNCQKFETPLRCNLLKIRSQIMQKEYIYHGSYDCRNTKPLKKMLGFHYGLHSIRFLTTVACNKYPPLRYVCNKTVCLGSLSIQCRIRLTNVSILRSNAIPPVFKSNKRSRLSTCPGLRKNKHNKVYSAGFNGSNRPSRSYNERVVVFNTKRSNSNTS